MDIQKLTSTAEYFNGSIRGTYGLLILNGVLILHFIYCWYRNYRKWGWKFDFWNMIMAKTFLVPLLFLYPFNRSFKNVPAFSMKNFVLIEQYVDKAFLITALGYICFYIGRYIYALSRRHVHLNALTRPIETLVEHNIKNFEIVSFVTFISIFLLSIIVIFQISTGNLFNPRNFFLQNGYLRPLYNLTLIFYPLAIAFTGLRMLNTPNDFRKLTFIFLVIFSIFLGTRIAVLEPLLIVFLFFCLKYNHKIQIRKILLVGVGFIYFTMIVLSFRSEEVGNVLSTSVLKSILYGNTFSDTRDFAFILVKWDNVFLLGKTYIAGLMSFIPRQFSDFREIWALGKFTARITDYNSDVFPGFRPGYFGEVFFNFGYRGVIILGIISGYALRHVDLRIKESIVVHGDVIKGYSRTFLWMFVTCLSISIGFTALYVFVGMTLFFATIRQVIIYLQRPKGNQIGNIGNLEQNSAI